MTTAELRIGNLVLESGKVTVIESVGPNWINQMVFELGVYGGTAVSHDDIDTIEPIPLTEEWLLRFGFEKEQHKGSFVIRTERKIVFKKSWFVITKDAHHSEDFGHTDSTDEVTCDWRHRFTPTKHVHQLQNLYFITTGEELIINQTA